MRKMYEEFGISENIDNNVNILKSYIMDLLYYRNTNGYDLCTNIVREFIAGITYSRALICMVIHDAINEYFAESKSRIRLGYGMMLKTFMNKIEINEIVENDYIRTWSRLEPIVKFIETYLGIHDIASSIELRNIVGNYRLMMRLSRFD